MLLTEAFPSYQVVTLDSSLTASSIYKDDWGGGVEEVWVRVATLLSAFALHTAVYECTWLALSSNT